MFGFAVDDVVPFVPAPIIPKNNQVASFTHWYDPVLYILPIFGGIGVAFVAFRIVRKIIGRL